MNIFLVVKTVINPSTPNIFSGKCRLLFTSAAYSQVLLRLDLIMEANNMKPDQSTPKGSGHIWF